MPMPPSCAMAMARRASVTVSMAADTSGSFSAMLRVNRVAREVSLGRTSENAGTSNTSSKVSAFPRRRMGKLQKTDCTRRTGVNPAPCGRHAPARGTKAKIRPEFGYSLFVGAAALNWQHETQNCRHPGGDMRRLAGGDGPVANGLDKTAARSTVTGRRRPIFRKEYPEAARGPQRCHASHRSGRRQFNAGDRRSLSTPSLGQRQGTRGEEEAG